MANTLTNLIPDIYEAMDVVSREMVGLIPAVSRDSSADRAAKDQTVRSFVAPAATGYDITPGQLPADNGDQTIGSKTITISKSRYAPVRWSGEEQKGVNHGPGYNNIVRDQFAQAMRTLVNEVENDLAILYKKASRAVIPAGTTLFDAANYKDIANARKLLAENGAPMNDISLVLNPLAAAAFRGNAQYYGANTAGSQDFLRQGVLMNIHGVNVRESQQIYSATAGTNSSGRTNNAGYAVGDSTLTLDSNGTGTILAGDVISITGDGSAQYYVVTTGDSDVSNGGTIVLGQPGLRGALSAATHAITTNASTDKNMMFSRNAIHLVTRAPARPVEGDLAEDVKLVTDPVSGLTFEIAMYKEYRRIRYEVSLAWGCEVIKPEHLVLMVD